ncbi:MAG: class I SAM-dependent methyltransferase [Solirubrobacterales bacterium]
MNKRGPADRHAEVAYESIAPVYDDFTAHHDYETWIGTLLELAASHGLTGDTALDVACGTGKSFLPLLERGWQVTACDISASMLELARQKAGDRVRIELADMRELPVFGSFDLVFCLDDAVNYLHTQAELEAALRRMAANLAPDGVLVFDSNTLTNYGGFFTEHIEVEANGVRMIWDGLTPRDIEPGAICEARFSVEPLVPGGGPTIAPALHRQRHHPDAEVQAAIGAAGLELLGLYGHHHDGVPHQPMSETEHTKAIYLARAARAR